MNSCAAHERAAVRPAPRLRRACRLRAGRRAADAAEGHHSHRALG